MRRVLLPLIVVLTVLVPTAHGHGTSHSWTTGKATVMLPETATIALPPELRTSLESELTTLIKRFRLLELVAQQAGGDWLVAGTYANYVKRLGEARERVEQGLSVDSATCRGIGKPLKAKRYKHFRCEASSYVLEVPTIALRGGENGTLPEVVEGPVRRLGPYPATFRLHVTGARQFLAERLA